MVKKISLALLVVAASCSSSTDNKYDPSKYYDDAERAELLAGIVSYIFSAPPYTAMKDRFEPEHKTFYRETASRLFSLDRLYVNEKGRHFYLVVRPGQSVTSKRAAGGYFDVAEDKSFKNFRETFVTRVSSDSVARGKGRFLFDQMVKGDLQRFLKMGTYVQWPNAASYYDSTIYEWKMDVPEGDTTIAVPDTIRIN